MVRWFSDLPTSGKVITSITSTGLVCLLLYNLVGFGQTTTTTLLQDQKALNEKFVDIATKQAVNESERNAIERDRLKIDEKRLEESIQQTEAFTQIAAIAAEGREDRQEIINGQRSAAETHKKMSDTLDGAVGVLEQIADKLDSDQ